MACIVASCLNSLTSFDDISFGVVQHFVTFPEVTIVRCSRKHLFLKYGKKVRAEFLEMLEAAIFFQGFLHVSNWFFKTRFADIFRTMHSL